MRPIEYVQLQCLLIYFWTEGLNYAFHTLGLSCFKDHFHSHRYDQIFWGEMESNHIMGVPADEARNGISPVRCIILLIFIGLKIISDILLLISLFQVCVCVSFLVLYFLMFLFILLYHQKTSSQNISKLPIFLKVEYKSMYQNSRTSPLIVVHFPESLFVRWAAI